MFLAGTTLSSNVICLEIVQKWIKQYNNDILKDIHRLMCSFFNIDNPSTN